MTHPFESAIAAIEAKEFAEGSFVESMDALIALYFIKEVTCLYYRPDLEGVTEAGYLRLITLAVRALNEFPASMSLPAILQNTAV